MPEEGAIRSGRIASPLGARAKLGYASGALLDGIGQHTVAIFLFFYVTAVCGLPAGLAGIALAAGLVVDAIVDPLIGSLSDGWRSAWGRRLPFMAAGAPLTMIFLILIFSLPHGWSTGSTFAWLTLLSIGLRVSISLFLLPYNAVGAELSDDYAERSSIAAWRWGFAMIGALIAIVLGFGVFLSGPRGLADRAGYTPFALTLAAVAALGALGAIRAVARTRDRQFAPAVVHGAAMQELRSGLGEVFRNQSFRTLFAGAILLFTSLSVHSTLGLHANSYFWRLAPAQMQAVTLALFSGLLLGAPLAGPMLKRMEKRTVLLIGIMGLGLALSAPATLRLFGLLSLQGSTLVTFLSLMVLAGGMLMAAAAIAFASMMADAADEHEHLFGTRREGLYFAGWAFASKAAAGAGSLIAGLLLQVIGFPSGAGAPSRLALPAGTVDWIGAIYGPGAGLLAIGAAVTCLFYRLDVSRHTLILSDLEARRTTADAAAPVIA